MRCTYGTLGKVLVAGSSRVSDKAMPSDVDESDVQLREFEHVITSVSDVLCAHNVDGAIT